MRSVHRYKDLEVYQRALDVFEATYRITDSLPPTERFGIADQMKRASNSIVANIAAGAGRGPDKEFAHFIAIARGSAFELEAHVEMCHRLEYIDGNAVDTLIAQLEPLKHKLNGLRRYLTKA